MLEVAEAVRMAPGLFDEQVDRFSAAVVDSAGGEVGQDLLAPLTQSLSEAGDLVDRTGVQCLEELVGRSLAGRWARGAVDAADGLVDPPGQLDFSGRVTDRKVLGRAGALTFGEVFLPGEQRSADLVERVVLVSPPVQRCLLDAAADLVDDVPGELDDMEGVQNRGGIGKLVADRVGVAAGRVECGVLDADLDGSSSVTKRATVFLPTATTATAITDAQR